VAPHLVHHQCKNDGSRELHGQGVNANPDGVTDQAPEVIGLEKPFKMFETDPRAVPYPLEGHKILERDLNPVDGEIAEKKVPDQHGDKHEVEVVVYEIRLEDLSPPR